MITPISRKEIYLAKISGEDIEVPYPITREEMYLAKLAGMEVTPPVPITRYEMFLSDLVNDTDSGLTPITRIEYLLARVNEKTEIEIDPITREEMLWDEIANAGIKGYEKTVGPLPIISISDARPKPAKSLEVTLSPIQDLHGYDSPWPAGGGVNLWDEEWVVEGTAIASKNRIPCEAGQWYYINIAPANGWRFYDAENNLIETAYTNYKQAPAGAVAMWFKLGTSYGTTYKNDVVVAKTTGSGVSVPYAPYSNVCPITGRTGISVTRAGRNLLPNTLPDNAIVGALRDDGTIASSTNSRVFAIRCKRNTTYAFQANTTGAGWGNVGFSTALPSVGGTYTRLGSMINRTLFSGNSGNNDYILIHATSVSDYGTLVSTNEGMVFEGSTASAYEPYIGTTYPVTWQTEAGTVYGGTLDLVSGVLTVTHGIVDLGTLTWTNWGGYLGMYSATVTGMKQPTSTAERTKEIACSSYKLAETVSLNDNMSDKACMRYQDKVIVRDKDYATKETFTEAVDGVQFLYPFDEPQTFSLTPTQIQMLRGANTLWSDGGQVKLTYIGTEKPVLGGMLGGMLGGSLGAVPTEEPTEGIEEEEDE